MIEMLKIRIIKLGRYWGSLTHQDSNIPLADKGEPHAHQKKSLVFTHPKTDNTLIRENNQPPPPNKLNTTSTAVLIYSMPDVALISKTTPNKYGIIARLIADTTLRILLVLILKFKIFSIAHKLVISTVTSNEY